MTELNPIDVHVGKKLRLGRTLQGMSQESVGEAVGVTFQQIQKYERGVNCVRASRLFDLAKVLRVPITFFFEGFGSKDYPTDAPNYGMGAADSGNASYDAGEAKLGGREGIELMRAFNRIKDPKLRAKIVARVRSIADGDSLIA